ncbi:hypothetical protein BaRGS_00018948 [Batillaria attramentaria]|uniref:Fucosyltransferase n=1 Tax=Batillaria attramentaria TaxID=370345 RepID=A0ABD0KRL6_9CAEN
MPRSRCSCKTLCLAIAAILLVGYFLVLHSSSPSTMTVASASHGTRSGKEFQPTVVKKPMGREMDFYQTHDKWPIFSEKSPLRQIPRSPFYPNFTIKWDFDTAAFLQRPDVRGKPPKIMTWAVKTRYMPQLPEPVRMRFCPEMPCRMTTNMAYKDESAALMWAGQIMREPAPPGSSRVAICGVVDFTAVQQMFQVFLFHNHEPQKPDWTGHPSFRKPAWKSAFNWTMTYRNDSDLVGLYGALSKRETPLVKNYTDIVAKKTKMAAWLSSHCKTHGRREDYIKLLQRHLEVDAFGECGHRCPRSADDTCFQTISSEYKFYLAFENAFCKDYISEKFFRYLEADVVVVARASNEFRFHAPPGIFVNTADFATTKDLADYLLYLDANPSEYIKILQAKDRYQPVYEDYPIRKANGDINYMHYHYEALAFCEMCRRLWDLDTYRKTIPDIAQWFDKANCYPPDDIK